MKQSAAEGIQTAPSSTAAVPVARLNVRISAYVVDSVVLLLFILTFFVISGGVLLIASDFGAGDAPDAAYYAFISTFIGGPLISWTLFNLALMRWRAQSAGMYVIGIKTVTEDGQPPAPGTVLLRWFALHPLLFHPLLLPIWVMLALFSVSITLSQVVLIVTVTLALLCIVSPIASLLAMSFDAERRALHDRVAHTLVVRIEEAGRP